MDPEARPADPEAIFRDAQLNAVQVISDATASAKAGAAAGAAAAAKALAAFTSAVGSAKPRPAKGAATPPDTPPGATPVVALTKEQKKRKRDDKRKADKLAAAAGAVDLTAPAPAAAAAALVTAADAAATAAAGAASALIKQFNPPVKYEPFAVGEPAAASIRQVLDKKGSGLVEILDRLHFAEMGTDMIPCGWHATLGKCRDHEDPNAVCRRCVSGVAAMPKVLSRAKAALHPDLKLPPASLVLKAA